MSAMQDRVIRQNKYFLGNDLCRELRIGPGQIHSSGCAAENGITAKQVTRKIKRQFPRCVSRRLEYSKCFLTQRQFVSIAQKNIHWKIRNRRSSRKICRIQI